MLLEIDHLSPYFPYSLPIKILNFKCDYVGIEYSNVNGFYILDKQLYVTYDGGSTGKGVNDFKPILKPLSDYQKVFNEYLSTYWSNFDYFCQCVYSRSLEYSDMINLIEAHYDVFDLIINGLAIDINELNKINDN